MLLGRSVFGRPEVERTFYVGFLRKLGLDPVKLDAT
jgi:hypothetical protein